MLHGRRFRVQDRTVALTESREGVVTGSYAGGDVVAGALVGRRDDAELVFAWSALRSSGTLRTGTATCEITGAPGALTLLEQWSGADGSSGTDTLVEIPGPRWVRARVAHPSASLAAAIAFYGDLLGLPVDGPYADVPYDLVFFALPGGGQLELVAGGPSPRPATDEDLLVLYVPLPADVAELRSRVVAAGLAPVPSANPYWSRMGFQVRDPDGRLVVVAHLPA